MDVVEPEVKEPSNNSTTSSSSTQQRARAASSFFTDVNAEEAATGGATGAAGTTGAAGGAASSSTGPSGTEMTAMMEQMLKDPNMQKMLYPYLPEPMRNPQSIEWMMSNPEVKKQMEAVFASQVTAALHIVNSTLSHAEVHCVIGIKASIG